MVVVIMLRAVSRLVFPDCLPGSDRIGLAGLPSILSVTVCWNDGCVEQCDFSYVKSGGTRDVFISAGLKMVLKVQVLRTEEDIDKNASE